jgi:C-terminal processing protease CtpA/Prc
VIIRSFALVFIVASSFVITIGQTPDDKNDAGPAPNASTRRVRKQLRDLPFPGGVDLQFIIKELARDLDLNVLFDIDSFRTPGRKTFIDLKNVTAAAALDYILLQEKLYFEEAGPRAIIVAAQAKGKSIPQMGAGVIMIDGQLAQYFGTDRGVLISHVRDNSSASKAGLKAGDVIVEIDGVPVRGAVGLANAIVDKNGADVILTIVRDRKRQPIGMSPEKEKGVSLVLQ